MKKKTLFATCFVCCLLSLQFSKQAACQTSEFPIIREPTPEPNNTSTAPSSTPGAPPAAPPGGGPPAPLTQETLPPPPPPKPVDRLTVERAIVDQQISQTIQSIQNKQREIDTELYPVYRAPLILEKQFLEQHLEDLRQQRDNLESQQFAKETKEQLRKQQNQ